MYVGCASQHEHDNSLEGGFVLVIVNVNAPLDAQTLRTLDLSLSEPPMAATASHGLTSAPK